MVSVGLCWLLGTDTHCFPARAALFAWCKNTSRPQNSPWLFLLLPSQQPWHILAAQCWPFAPSPCLRCPCSQQDPVPGGGPPPLPCTRMQLEEYLKCLFYSCSYNTVSLWPRTVAPQQSWEEGWLLTLWQKKKGRESLCRTSQAPCASPGHHSRAKESVPPLLVPTGHPRGSGSPVAACASGCTATCGTITLNTVGASDPSPGHGRGQGLTAGAAENRLKQ